MRYDEKPGKCLKLSQRPWKCRNIKDNYNNKYTFRVLSVF